jgi:hypothetical protein
VNEGSPDEIYEVVLRRYTPITGARMARVLAEKSREYERLVREIDGDYEAGRLDGIEDKEVAAERILEELDSYAHVFGEEAEDEALDQEASLMPYLSATFGAGPEKWSSYDDWISNMREAIVDSVKMWGRTPPADEQVLAVARDAHARWTALVGRYKAKR